MSNFTTLYQELLFEKIQSDAEAQERKLKSPSAEDLEQLNTSGSKATVKD